MMEKELRMGRVVGWGSGRTEDFVFFGLATHEKR
jgi:hypothetical protein